MDNFENAVKKNKSQLSNHKLLSWMIKNSEEGQFICRLESHMGHFMEEVVPYLGLEE